MGSEKYPERIEGFGTLTQMAEGRPVSVVVCPLCQEPDKLVDSCAEDLVRDKDNLDPNVWSCWRCEYAWKQVPY